VIEDPAPVIRANKAARVTNYFSNFSDVPFRIEEANIFALCHNICGCRPKCFIVHQTLIDNFH